MDSSQDLSGNGQEELAENVVESLGEPESATDDVNQSTESVGNDNTGDPLYVQKRLKQQKRAHEREIRELHARIAQMQNQSPREDNYDASNYANETGVDETIQKAVSFALRQKEMEERKAKEAEAQMELAKQYQTLQKHLDQTSDKYDDFEDVVRGSSTPFTPTIRDAALLLPTEGPGAAGEVLYKLAKNPEELKRISNLLPHQQAAEVIRLSHALIRGGDKEAKDSRPLQTIKSNPVVNSAGVTDKTSPAQIRALMKAGKFK